MGKYHRWRDIRNKNRTPEEIAALDRQVERELIAMDLREIRGLVGKTQTDLAAELDMTQSEVSRLERRDDVRLSTLKRYVEALGGTVEVFAAFGDKRVRLRAIS